MTLKQLQTFYWVCHLGSFIAAAERLHTTQSTVSMRIHDLEQSFGIELFDRSMRTVRPTAKGVELLVYVERLMALTTEMQQRLADPGVLTGTVRLGVTEMVAVTWLSELLANINERYPGVTIELIVDVSIAHTRKLINGELDLALVPGPAPELDHISLGLVQFAWMASPKLEIPDRCLTPHELVGYPMLGLNRDSKHQQVVTKWLNDAGARTPSMNICNSIGILSVLTIAGLGIGYLPFGYFTNEMIRLKQLRVLDTQPAFPPFEYCALFDKRRPQPLAIVIAELAASYSTFNGSIDPVGRIYPAPMQPSNR